MEGDIRGSSEKNKIRAAAKRKRAVEATGPVQFSEAMAVALPALSQLIAAREAQIEQRKRKRQKTKNSAKAQVSVNGGLLNGEEALAQRRKQLETEAKVLELQRAAIASRTAALQDKVATAQVLYLDWVPALACPATVALLHAGL